MSALWVLPLVVLVAGAAAIALVTRRLATEAGELQREAGAVRELVQSAEAARAEATEASTRGVEVAALQARVASLRRQGRTRVRPNGR